MTYFTFGVDGITSSMSMRLQVPGVADGQGSGMLQSMGSKGVRHD